MRVTCLLLAAFSVTTLCRADEYRTFTDQAGRALVAKVLKVSGDKVIIERKSDSRQFPVSLENLIEADREWLAAWEAARPDSPAGGAASGVAGAEADGDLNRQLYSRTRSQIRERVETILARPIPNGMESGAGAATNVLNVYRYLCGVGDEVEADATMNERSEQAAAACEKHGSLSHDLGSYTNICNLHQGSEDMAWSVTSYIEDSGENNRVARGHRRWCLNPPMGKAGFGQSGRFHGMACMDNSARSRVRDTWAYPGKGFFPLDRLHGNAWSLYLQSSAPEARVLTVTMWKLHSRPPRPLSWTAEPEGEEVAVDWVSTASNSINFEPAIVREPGIYWVRIRGGGVREHYLVELF